MDFSNKLRTRGVKVTPQRIAVYKALESLGHASVEEIAAKVAEQNPAITTATVYNVLDCFAVNELVMRLNTPMGRMYYDISTHPHHHFITPDGTIFDYESDELTKLIDNYLHDNPPTGFNIERVSLQIIGQPSAS